MTRSDHLLIITEEEANELAEACTALALQCNRLAIRISKSLRFSGEEIQPGQLQTNAERISAELTDLIGVAKMLINEDIIPPIDSTKLEEKRVKIEFFLKHSAKNGKLDSDSK